MSDEITREELLRREELARVVARNHAETGTQLTELKTQLTANLATVVNQFDRYVLTAVYEANERARDAREEARDQRVKRLEDNETSNRRGNRSAILACISAVAATIAVAVLTKSGVWH